MCAYQASSDCECCAADERHMPIGSRTTSGTRRLAAEHVARLRGLVDELVDGAEREVGEAHLDDRPRAHHGGADRGAHDAGLRDRRVGDALRPELLDEALVLAEHAAAAEVLADRPHVGRAASPRRSRRGRLGVAHHCHGAPQRFARRRHRAPSPRRGQPLAVRSPLPPGRGRALAPDAIRRPPARVADVLDVGEGALDRRIGRRLRRRRRPGAFPQGLVAGGRERAALHAGAFEQRRRARAIGSSRQRVSTSSFGGRSPDRRRCGR